MAAVSRAYWRQSPRRSFATCPAGPNGTVWTGELFTSAIRAVRDGKPVVWDQPLRAGFAARLGPDRWPVFDKLEAQSDFVGLAARGSAEEFAAAATVDLSRLSERLRDFVDLEGIQLSGLAEVRVNTKPAPPISANISPPMSSSNSGRAVLPSRGAKP